MNKRILIVDDDQTIRHLLGRLLEKEGYETASAVNGEEGLGALKVQHIDLIVLDILMPIMDGFEFFKEIKSNPVTHDIPVLVLTIRKHMEDSFMALGADSFMGKPLNSAKLLSEIKMIFNDKTPSRETHQKTVSKVPYIMPAASAVPQEVGPPEKTVPKNILVAGSMDHIVNFMVNNFKQLGCQVVTASSGEEVIKKALQFAPEIILMEINMDAISVNEITAALAKNPELKTQILLYSIFMTRETEKNSILKTLYAKKFGSSQYPTEEKVPEASSEAKETNPLIHYLGAFHKESFFAKIMRLFPSLDNC